MEPEIIAVMGTVIVALAAALGRVTFNNRNNNRPRDHGHANPGVVDLSTTKLGDMSAAWYEEKHKELLNAVKDLTEAVKGKVA